MQGLLLKVRRKSVKVLLLAAAATLAACAKDQPALVDDSATKESSMPWNKQEKWETQGQMGGITDRR